MQTDANQVTIAHHQRAIAQLNEQWIKRVEAIGSDIALRKWCIEHGTLRLEAHEVLRFLTEPLLDAIQDASPRP